MKVFLGAGGWFHSDRMAIELKKRNHLLRYVTTAKLPSRDQAILGSSYTRLPFLPYIETAIARIPGLSNVVKPWHWKDPFVAQRLATMLPSTADLAVIFASYAQPAFKKARSLKIPTVLERSSAHILTQLELINGQLTSWVIDNQLREYDLSDYIVVPSQFVAKSFIDRGYPRERLLILPLGVDIDFFSMQNIQHRPFRILYAGSLSAQKGVDTLLQSWEKIRKLVDGELILVGGIDDTMKEYLKLSEIPHRHIKFVSRDKLVQLYGSASVFVLPSRQDGFGMVALEAMACGLPTIVSENCGVSELIQDGKNGFRFKAGDALGLSEALMKIYQTESVWKKLSLAARKTAEENQWSAYGERLVEIYKKILKH